MLDGKYKKCYGNTTGEENMIQYKDFKNTLEEKIKECEQVVITPHIRIDMDAIASSIGMAAIGRKYGKQSFILLDDDPLHIEAGARKIIEDAKKHYEIISLSEYLKRKTDQDLLVMCDVNKKNMVSCEKILSTFQNIFIIDHHSTDENTVDTPFQFIDKTSSSASEIVAQLSFVSNLKITPKLAEFLLAGIALDTQRFSKVPVDSAAFHVVYKLTKKGTSIEAIEPYFVEDYQSYRRWNGLVDKAEFQTFKAAIVVGDDKEIYTSVEIAKAANCLLNFDVDASFVVGRVANDAISISARSKGAIDAGTVMHDMSTQGGGSPILAAARITDSTETTETVGTKLKQKIQPTFYIR